MLLQNGPLLSMRADLPLVPILSGRHENLKLGKILYTTVDVLRVPRGA